MLEKLVLTDNLNGDEAELVEKLVVVDNLDYGLDLSSYEADMEDNQHDEQLDESNDNDDDLCSDLPVGIGRALLGLRGQHRVVGRVLSEFILVLET